MAEVPTRRQIRAAGAHGEISGLRRPVFGEDSLPHGKAISAVDQGEGLFFPGIGVSGDGAAATVEVVGLEPRALKFRPETRLYKVTKDANGQIIIPRTPQQEANLFKRELRGHELLDVPAEYLERGARGGTVTKRVGRSQFGAFTIVLDKVIDKEGKSHLEERLASYLNRSRKGKI